MNKRTLIASTNPWSFCMAVERELARSNSEATVDAINLFTLCSRGSPHWRRRDKIIETVNRKIERFVMPAVTGRDISGDINIDHGNIPPLPASFEELRSYELGGAKIGLAVLSSVSSLTTIQVPSCLGEYGAALEPAWRTAHLAKRLGEAIRQIGYYRIYIFNGRHCYSRPFCDVLEQGAEVIRYEQGSAGNRYICAPGSVHHPKMLASIIEAHEFDAAAGDAFFQDRLKKHPGNEVGLLTAQQQQGLLPAPLEVGRTATFFTSCADEMFAVTDEPLYGSFATQHEIAVAFTKACRQQRLQPVIRLHPHLRFKHQAWIREWDFEELERGGALVLGPTDATDTYALLQASRCIITTGSTVGLEASYLNIPNAVVGTWVAGCIGASRQVNTSIEIAQFLTKPEPSADAKKRALLFGSYYRKGGTPLPELAVGTHPNFARIGGRIVDPIRYVFQRLRDGFGRSERDPAALDIKSGMQGGRVVLPPGTDYSSLLETKSRRAYMKSGTVRSIRSGRAAIKFEGP